MLTLDRFNLQPAAFLLQFSRQVIQDVQAILVQPLLAALSPHFQLQSSQDWLVLGGAVLTGFLVLLYLVKQPGISFSKKNTFAVADHSWPGCFSAGQPALLGGRDESLFWI